MSTLTDRHAHGVDEVRALEASLGFKAPDLSITEAVCRDLIRTLEARAERQQEEMRRTAELSRPVLDVLLGNPALEEAAEQMRADQKRRMAEKFAPPPLGQASVSLEAQFRANANFHVQVPPYGGDFATGSGATVSKDQGTFSLDVQGIGSQDSCYLSMGSWFYTAENNPSQRFAAPINFNKYWQESAMGYVAHSRFSTVVGIRDGSTNTDVIPPVQIQPTWNDGVGWFETHGENIEGDYSLAEVFFPATAGHLYFCQIGFSASVDADIGPFGVADSTIHLNGQIPWLVLGSLF
ncbi:hypothetical protein [Streptomyces sp. NPDC004728]|uniref:hypothetical protein n=1 Tax=Streptomyces sp. NPDC004728 TaxID=3154289 RepID=UPI0033B146DB